MRIPGNARTDDGRGPRARRTGPASELLAIVCAACVPEIDPPWLIDEPTELALQTTVVEQGPYGERNPADATRTMHEALPGDLIEFSAFIVDVDGPLSEDRFFGRWVICEAVDCLVAMEEAPELPPCEELDEPFATPSACLAGEGLSTTYRLGSLPTEFTEVHDLSGGPNVVFIGSTERARLDACSLGLGRRSGLDGCLYMIRRVAIGPVSALLDIVEDIIPDYEPPIGFERLLAAPRNRNPMVQEFTVRTNERTEIVAAGGTLAVTLGEELRISWHPQADDLGQYEVEILGEMVWMSKDLGGRFFFDRRTSTFVDDGINTVRLRVEGDPGLARIYFVTFDSAGSEAWGDLNLDIAPP